MQGREVVSGSAGINDAGSHHDDGLGVPGVLGLVLEEAAHERNLVEGRDAIFGLLDFFPGEAAEVDGFTGANDDLGVGALDGDVRADVGRLLAAAGFGGRSGGEDAGSEGDRGEDGGGSFHGFAGVDGWIWQVIVT